jgi:hypothetical protein
MLQQTTPAAYQPQRIHAVQSRAGLNIGTGLTEEFLPFTVRVVHDDEDLNKAVSIRHSAYARHVPEFADTLRAPERADGENGVVVLLAESKLDGSPLGTMRIQTNQFRPLSLEQSVELPNWLKSRPLAEATRLGVTGGKGGRLVTTVLFKAFFLYCQQAGIEWMVVTGRAPVDRQYDRLLFNDVFPGMGYIPFRHVGNMPHRVMCFNVETAEARWAAAKHPLLAFMCQIHHPDIALDGSLNSDHQLKAYKGSLASCTTFPM